MLFPPLSHLEVVGNPTVEKFDGKPVVVFTIRVNINQKARTIEEVLSQRKQTAVVFAENVAKELTFDVKLISNSDSTNVGIVLNELLMSYKTKSPEWFNSDVNLQDALGKVLEAKQLAVSAFVKSDPSLRGNPEKVFLIYFPRERVCIVSFVCPLQYHIMIPPLPFRFATPNCWMLQVAARRK